MARRLASLIVALSMIVLSPKAMAQEIMETGVIIFPHSTGTFRTNFKLMADGAPFEWVKIPIPFYVIRHPQQGIILFDSGLGRDFREQLHGWWMHRVCQLALPYQFRKSDSAVEQLKRLGVPPEAVRYIIVSHLHYDHAGGLRDFPNAVIVVSRGEWENAHVNRWLARLRGVMTEQLEGIEKRLWIMDYQPGSSFGPFDASIDLFADGSMILLSTPGHTPGHQSLLVTTGKKQKVLLTGDAVWVRENYQRPAPKGWIVRHFEEDGEEAWATTIKIKKFSELYPDVMIIPGHDPHLWKKLPSAIR